MFPRWEERVATELTDAINRTWDGPEPPPLLPSGDEGPYETRHVEWPAFPARLADCLGRKRALELLDWVLPDRTPLGRLRHQEEYLEWRLVKDGGRVVGIEMTTELPEYWETMAGLSPSDTIATISTFADEPVRPQDVYGEDFDASWNRDQLEVGFRRTMLGRTTYEHPPSGPISPLNSGVRAITCMTHRDNTLNSLFKLVISCARPLWVTDQASHEIRYPSGEEAIQALDAYAIPHRNSDPLVIERIVRLVSEGRKVGFDPPIGIYIQDVQLHQLALPDGTSVPSEWLTFSRGADDDGTTEDQRSQRAKLAIPPDAALDLSDLIVRRTAEPLTYGGQLAELTQLIVSLRVSQAHELEPNARPAPPPAGLDCAEALASWSESTREP